MSTIAPEATLDQVLQALGGHRYLGVNEYAIQDGIAQALSENGITFEREKRLGPRERLDFAVGDIAIEVKIRATRAEIIRQLARYATHDCVHQLVLATPSRVLLSGLPDQIHHVPVTGALLRGGTL